MADIDGKVKGDAQNVQELTTYVSYTPFFYVPYFVLILHKIAMISNKMRTAE